MLKIINWDAMIVTNCTISKAGYRATIDFGIQDFQPCQSFKLRSVFHLQQSDML